MLDRKKLMEGELTESRSDGGGGCGVSGSMASRLRSPIEGRAVDGLGSGAGSSAPNVGGGSPEWGQYVPEGVLIPEKRRRELHREHERYLTELIEEVGEPTAEEVAQAEAWWHPIEQHLTKDASA